MIIHQPNQSTHPTHESRSNTWQEKIMAQPENLKEMVTLIIRKSDFIHANQSSLFFSCFMHPSFTCRLAFVTCASHVQTLIIIVLVNL